MDAKWLDRRWFPHALALSAVLLLAITVLDATTSNELDLTPFYLAPIAISAWYGGYRWGALGTAAAMTAWGCADHYSGHVYSTPFYAVWAGIDRVLAFVFFAGTVSWLSQTHRRLLAVHGSREEGERRFRSLFDNAEVGMFRTRSDGSEALEGNDKFLEILGKNRAEVIGRPSANYWADPQRRAEMMSRLEADGRVTDFEFELVRKDGEVRHCLTSLRLFREEGLTEGSILDITERKLAERRNAELQAQLHQAQKMESLGILVAGVAHNINNVLGIVMGTASLREQRATDPADRESYQSIGKACRRGKEVVKSLIHFAQPTLSSQAPFELNALVQEVCLLLENTTRNRVQVVQTLAGEALWISGDAGSISHALVNLSINAIDAMPDGGTLRFATGLLEDGQVEVTVSDDGAGIPPEVLARVMDPFFTTKEVGKGTGLGLSMTYGVVKAHGGSIDIASDPGRGTAVALRLPRIPAPVPAAATATAALPPGPLKVYLVDDDEDVRFLMTRMLKQVGVRLVKTFAGGAALLEGLRADTPPDLLILDQNMPGMNGAQTLAAVRALHPELPVLISSGQPDIEDLECFRKPRVGIISKPFDMGEIRTKLAQF